MSLRLRAAGPADTERVALLHADSWRRFYRGAYADAFLDGDVVSDRRSVWSSRLAAAASRMTFVAEQATDKSRYLWVLEQNTAAQRFYRASGGRCVEKAAVSPPGGVPARLNGTPNMLRFSWPDASVLKPVVSAVVGE